MNGKTTTVIDDRQEITTTVRRHRVTLELDRTELGAILGGLAVLTADARQLEHVRTVARDLLWRILADASGPTRTIDRRGEAQS